MSDVTYILAAIETGDVDASARLLPLVYDELRRLAAQRMSQEAAGHTLDPTALVHEAYLRLVDQKQPPSWNSRGHFYCAAAEAMQRILIENARRKRSIKHGGAQARIELDVAFMAADESVQLDDMIALDEALEALAQTDREAAGLVRLRYFAGLTLQQAAELLGVSPRTADRIWVYARAWLHKALREN